MESRVRRDLGENAPECRQDFLRSFAQYRKEEKRRGRSGSQASKKRQNRLLRQIEMRHFVGIQNSSDFAACALLC